MVPRKRERPTKATPLSDIANARGRRELLYVDLDNDLIVGVRLRNLEALLALGLIPDPLMNAAMRFGKRVEANPEDVSGILDGIEAQDVICANTIMEPPYASLDEVRRNGGDSVPGKLDFTLLTSNQIRSLIMLVMHGLDAWESFRDEQRRARASLDRENVVDEPERVPEEPSVDSPDAEAADGSSVDYAGPSADDTVAPDGEQRE